MLSSGGSHWDLLGTLEYMLLINDGCVPRFAYLCRSLRMEAGGVRKWHLGREVDRHQLSWLATVLSVVMNGGILSVVSVGSFCFDVTSLMCLFPNISESLYVNWYFFTVYNNYNRESAVKLLHKFICVTLSKCTSFPAM